MNKTILSLLAVPMLLSAQTQRIDNPGLTHPQAESSLPVSRSKQEPRVAKVSDKPVRQTKLTALPDGKYRLDDGWCLWSDDNPATVYRATVPGTVLTTLIDNGVYPDPYYGLNNLSIPDSLCRTDWWYAIDFDAPVQIEGKEAWIEFEGINYIADINLNGTRLGRIKGAFRRGHFNATGLMKPEGNRLLVKIRPPHNPGIPHEQSSRAGNGGNGGQLCMDGPTFIASEGWDWVPGIRDRNIGIWQDVNLRFTSGTRIKNPHVVSRLELPDTTVANLKVSAEIENLQNRKKEATVTIEFDGRKVSKVISLDPMETRTVMFSPSTDSCLSVKNPRLWWPNGYGAQNLYDLTISVKEDGHISDTENTRFGIRELSYEMAVADSGNKVKRIDYRPTSNTTGRPALNTTDRHYIEGGMCMPRIAEGIDPAIFAEVTDPDMEHYLVVKVNGRRIFCRGGNWGMDDGMKRVDRTRMEPYFRLHKEANFNMIRNWTGESTEKTFYDLCDEYGMLVFNDFWLSTENYNRLVNDDDLFLDNAKETIIRYRNHPSIALWNPRNEGFAPEYIDKALSEMVTTDDGTRLYSPNSTHCNLRPSGPWDYKKNPAWYFTDRIYGFNTEQGTTSIPVEESIRAMMDEADTWPIGDVWYYHDLHGGQNAFQEDLADRLGSPQSLSDFCKKAQLLNYDSHRAMLEACNSRMWNSTSGLLLWMSHPAWPSFVWQIYSWDYETMGSFYGCRKACEPLHIQLNAHNRTATAINTTLNHVDNARAVYTLYSLDGKKIHSESQKLDLKANSAYDLFACWTPEYIEIPLIQRLTLLDSRGRELSANDYLLADSDNSLKHLNSLPQAELTAKVTHKDNRAVISLYNRGKKAAIAIKLNARHLDSGERILPAYASDGYFNLLPGEKRTVTIEYDHALPSYITAEAYNMERRTL